MTKLVGDTPLKVFDMPCNQNIPSGMTFSKCRSFTYAGFGAVIGRCPAFTGQPDGFLYLPIIVQGPVQAMKWLQLPKVNPGNAFANSPCYLWDIDVAKYRAAIEAVPTWKSTSSLFVQEHYDRLIGNKEAAKSGQMESAVEFAMFLAQSVWETDARWNLQNTEECSSTDITTKTWCCRGYLHLTGQANYNAAQLELAKEGSLSANQNIVTNPNLVSTDQTIAWRSALYYWRKMVRICGGCQGKGVDLLKMGLFGASTCRINANECQNGGNYGEYWRCAPMYRFLVYKGILSKLAPSELADEGSCYTYHSSVCIGQHGLSSEVAHNVENGGTLSAVKCLVG